MILFHLQTLGAGSHFPSFEFLNNKMLKNILPFLVKNVTFFVFLMERDRKRKNYECDGLGNSIPYKMMFVSATQDKNCGRRCIFSGQSAILQGEGKTHRNITILTMCKIST